MTKYKTLSDGIEAKIVNGKAYVRTTSMCYGMLEQGGHINRIYRAKTDCKTIADLTKTWNAYGGCELDMIIDNEANIIRYGNIIK